VRIVDLRAGTYALSCNLTGSSTVKREGIEFTGVFTAVVNTEMRAETVTVHRRNAGRRHAKRQTAEDNDLIAAIPAARAYGRLMTLMPDMIVATGTNAARADER
jgi:hypothetical protein